MKRLKQREHCCRVYPERCAALSFQHLPGAAVRLQSLFGIDLASACAPEIWSPTHIAFMRRHLLANKAGVVDQAYLNETQEPSALVGRRLTIDPAISAWPTSM